MNQTTLPIHAFEDKIVAAVRASPVVVIAAETGAGKSTQVPRMLLRAGFGEEGIIGVTEPRRVAAISLATWVAELEENNLGETIGFQIRGERALSRFTH